MALERGIVGRVAEDINEWINNVTRPQEALGGFPVCPYAAKATYCIKECTLSDVGPVEGVDIAIFVVGDCEVCQMMQRCSELNMIYRDYIFLDDHSSEPSYINGVQTNCAKHNVIIVQRRDDLLDARSHLSKTEYYQYWSKEMYNRIVKG